MEVYYVWVFKASSWWGNNGSYTSDIKNAKEFDHAGAIKFCRVRSDKLTGMGAIAVSKANILEVMK